MRPTSPAPDNPAMASQIDRVTAELRRRILEGELPAGSRVLEVQFAASLGVSRTPLRLALVELEKQGVLERVGSRGFQVRGFTLDDVAMALAVRGTLEGMAASLVARAGCGAAALQRLKECVQSGRALIDRATGSGQPIETAQWALMNAHFHETLVAEAGNSALTAALAEVNRTPMARPGALWVTGANSSMELGFVQRAQFDHEDLVKAIEARDSAAADLIMREHARRSVEAKRALAQAPGQQTEAGLIRGGASL